MFSSPHRGTIPPTRITDNLIIAEFRWVYDTCIPQKLQLVLLLLSAQIPQALNQSCSWKCNIFCLLFHNFLKGGYMFGTTPNIMEIRTYLVTKTAAFESKQHFKNHLLVYVQIEDIIFMLSWRINIEFNLFELHFDFTLGRFCVILVPFLGHYDTNSESHWTWNRIRVNSDRCLEWTWANTKKYGFLN